MKFKDGTIEKYKMSEFIKLLEKNETNEEHYASLCSQAFIG